LLLGDAVMVASDAFAQSTYRSRPLKSPLLLLKPSSAFVLFTFTAATALAPAEVDSFRQIGVQIDRAQRLVKLAQLGRLAEAAA
jgi:hypothetical protein